ncbi:MAG TPA: SH3-like domain-containing protein [Dongiaceae bacterium]|nr:SH3-like domain-containing protein [Dongiaceae bacterium]
MAEPAFGPGMTVRVRDIPVKGHMRTPAYVRGRQGWIEGLQGVFPNPERRAYGADGLPPVPLYLVRFRQSDLWPGYDGGDSLVLDIFEHWLESAEKTHGP